jgi:hypothetical protein
MATTQIGPPSGGGTRKPQVTGRIDLAGDGDLAHWIKVLDTTHDELLAAIDKVGTDAADVAAYLKRGSDAEPPAVPQIPDGG